MSPQPVGNLQSGSSDQRGDDGLIGHVDRENCPRLPLTLITKLPGAPWRDLEPDEPEYELFHMAHRWQGKWDEQLHLDFWRASLPLWPRKTGNRQLTDALTQSVRRLRAEGASNSEAEALLGYKTGSLRRMGVFRQVDKIEAAWSSVPVEHVSEVEAEQIIARRLALRPTKAVIRSLPLIAEQGHRELPSGVTAFLQPDFIEEALSPADREAGAHVGKMYLQASRALQAERRAA